MKNRPSLTAMGIAVMRALESEKPEGERLFNDPYAKLFVDRWLYRLMKFFIDIGYAEKRGPGAQGYIIARTRYIDDYLKACIKNGIEQLVIMGAGYDSRAYRIDGVNSLDIFEVDHPATQRSKLEKLKKVFGRVPDRVTYVSVDFTKETLEKRLMESGYNPKRKTLFIWEGVTPYITAEGVDSTLSFIVNNSGPGSSIIFDYVHKSVIDGRVRRGEISSMQRYRKISGEGLSFGIEEGTVKEFMESRGFDQVVNVTGEDLKRMYFSEPGREKTVGTIYAIVRATVK